jgi:DNA-binding CsgD family transcriptional regulator
LFDAEGYGSFLVVLVITLVFVVLYTTSVTIAPYGCDHLTIPEDYENDDEENEFRAARKAWGKACEIIAKRSKLTPRETEVFMLLAKGRNSRVIERELSISSHTVKSHNYNIYRKLGVESQQELIDAIELVHSKIKLTV